MTPLHVAALNGREDIVRFLLSKGAFINAEDSEENTALHAAARRGHMGTVDALLSPASSSVPPHPTATNKHGMTPGSVALLKGHAEIADVLVKKGAWKPEEERILAGGGGGMSGLTVLHAVAAAPEDQVTALKWVLSHTHIDVCDTQNAEKMTPLHCAAVAGNTGCCRALLASDSRQKDMKRMRDGQGRLPFQVVGSDAGNQDLKTLLLVDVDGAEYLYQSSITKTTTAQNDTSTSTSTRNRFDRFRGSCAADQRSTVRHWASLPTHDLSPLLQDFPGAEEIKRRLAVIARLQGAIRDLKAMASLRADVEFQRDIGRSDVYEAVLQLKKDPRLYDALVGKLGGALSSVVVKMGRVHAALQQQHQQQQQRLTVTAASTPTPPTPRQFSIQDVIVPLADVERRRKEDEEKVREMEREVEGQVGAVVAAAVAVNDGKAVEAAAAATRGLASKEDEGEGEERGEGVRVEGGWLEGVAAGVLRAAVFTLLLFIVRVVFRFIMPSSIFTFVPPSSSSALDGSDDTVGTRTEL